MRRTWRGAATSPNPASPGAASREARERGGLGANVPRPWGRWSRGTPATCCPHSRVLGSSWRGASRDAEGRGELRTEAVRAANVCAHSLQPGGLGRAAHGRSRTQTLHDLIKSGELRTATGRLRRRTVKRDIPGKTKNSGKHF